jgi:hypothetical protein
LTALSHRSPARQPVGTDEVGTSRRELTKLIAALAASTMLAETTSGHLAGHLGGQFHRDIADPAALAGHLALVDHLAGMYRAADPLPVLPAAAGYADRLLWHLDHGSLPADTANQLVPAVVGLHAQVGLWACHTDQPALARRYLAVAYDLAADTDDPALQARALGALSYRYSSAPRGGQGGNPQRALRLLDTALAKATMADAFTRGWLATWRADQHATLGNVDQARRDIAFARSALDQADDGGLTGFFAIDTYGYGMRGHLDSVYATVTALAGQQTQAEQAFATVHAAAANMRRRIATLGHQAFAFAAGGEPEAASAALIQSVTLAVTEHYGMGLRRAIGVRSAFAPAWAALPTVRDLDEHLALATAG